MSHVFNVLLLLIERFASMAYMITSSIRREYVEKSQTQKLFLRLYVYIYVTFYVFTLLFISPTFSTLKTSSK